MAISRKRAPFVSDAQINRAIQGIYEAINELINAVNQGNTSVRKPPSKGKAGDMRIVKDSAGTYFLEAKTDEGWIQSDSSASGFSFRDKE
tara:strand:- start:264 stop:533 length:270 start_codon:yes stop_codon:yes gene_type:complete